VKITGVKVYSHTGPYKPVYKSVSRSVGPLDIYDDYSSDVRAKTGRFVKDIPKRGETISDMFIVITTDEGFEGIHGPVDNRSQLFIAAESVAPHIIGRDPLDNRMIWDIMSRFDRHSRSGSMLMAISAIDNALWDLKGKILGQPVYKLLGGGRNRIRPYMSALGFSVNPKEAAEKALMIKDMGIKAQKWFFRYGPNDGAEGMRKNIELAETLRETLGNDYEIMFDCWMGWNIGYAKSIFPSLEAVKPMWIEEVLRPHMQDGYERLKAETNIPLSAGEHIYTRMEANHYLKKGIFDVMQSDPEWCGGITEAMKIGDMCELYGIKFIPHGHALFPAMHVVASMPPDTCPYAEYLLAIMDHKTNFFKYNPLDSEGFLNLNETPGLGQDFDMEKIIGTEEVKSLTFKA